MVVLSSSIVQRFENFYVIALYKLNIIISSIIMVELEQICQVAGRKMMTNFEGQQQQFIFESEASVDSLGSALCGHSDSH